MFTTHFTENGPPPTRRDSNTPSFQQQQQQQQQQLILAQQQVAAQQQAQQQQQQGMVNMFPTQAGHQLDLNHLWQQVQELSSILALNRESTQGLVRRADDIRNRDLVNVAGINGVNGVNGTTQADLEATNQALRSENAELRAENEDLSLLAQDYESVLEKVLEGLRVYARDHAASTINIHQTYTNQLNSERAQNAQLRQQETDNQMRLATISKLLREAYRDEGGEGLEVVVEALKVENRVLREALGLPVEDGEGGLSL